MKSTLRIPEHLFEQLQRHLFRADRDEHGALLLAGVANHGHDLVLLARELHLADARDFPPGRQGYRQLSPRLVAEIAGRAGDENLAYVSVHNHPGATTRVSFSSDDLAAHERLFPHLLDLTNGAPVGGLVLGSESAAGDVWLADGSRSPLDEAIIVGPNLRRLRPESVGDGRVPERFDRQVRLFGAEGQRRLNELHVGVVGAGGGGSLLVEQLAHLGIGQLTVIDFDRVSETNLSRIVGATTPDAKHALLKIDVLERLVRSIDPSIAYRGIAGDIVDLDVARELLATDFIFLATDTIRSRLVFNAVVHRYLIPGIQIGARVETTAAGQIEEVYVAVRSVFPSSGCLDCAGLIDPVALQQEMRTPAEAAAQNYVGGESGDAIVDPSVISLNGIGASHAVTTMLLAATGLASGELSARHQLFFPRDSSSFTVALNKNPACLFCSEGPQSALARGGSPSLLPCRQSPVRSQIQPSRSRRWSRWVSALRRASA